MIACYIRIIYFLIGIDISENFYDKDGERFFDKVVNLKEEEFINRTKKLWEKDGSIFIEVSNCVKYCAKSRL